MNAKCKTKSYGAMRMADGGQVSPWSIRGVYNRLTTPPPATKLTPIAPPQPVVTPPVTVTPPPQITPPQSAISQYAGMTALQRREKEAGLKDGGQLKTGKGGAVPGKGKGDKIPAKYEPGEFVVSNDMMKMEPGLQEHLHMLRNKTLASKGMTPAMAEAGRFKRGAIRALTGIDTLERPWNGMQDAKAFAPQLPGVQVSSAPMTADQAKVFNMAGESAHGARVNPVPLDNGRFGLPPNPAITPTAPAGTAPVAGQAPTLRAGISGQPGAIGKSLYAGGRALGSIARFAGSVAPAAIGADVVSHFNDYKINDPEVDSSAGGTLGALRAGDFSGAGRSLSKGALETGMDIGSAVANTADYLVPGKAPVSTAYNKMLRNQFGDQLAPDAGIGSQMNATPAPAIPKAVAPSAPTLSIAGDATLPGQDPGRVTLGGQSGADVIGAPGVSKFVQNGKTLYSNVAGPDNSALMNRGAISQQNLDAAQALSDKYKTQSQSAALQQAQQAEQETMANDELKRLALSPLGTPGRSFAQKQLGLVTQEATTRRGQDINATNQGAIQKLNQQKFGLDQNKDTRDATLSGLDAQSKTAILNAQKALQAAKTPDETAAAERNYQILLGKHGESAKDRYLVTGGGSAPGTDGITMVPQPQRIYDTQTRQYVDQVPNAKQALPPGLVVGAPYKGPDGDHRLPNGGTMTVKNGKVTAIK